MAENRLAELMRAAGPQHALVERAEPHPGVAIRDGERAGREKAHRLRLRFAGREAVADRSRPEHTVRDVVIADDLEGLSGNRDVEIGRVLAIDDRASPMCALAREVAALTAQLPRAELHAEPNDIENPGVSGWSRPQVAFHNYGFLNAGSASAPFLGFQSSV